jgi:molybdate/tungstate transport system substrate-binding protein
VQLSLGPAYHAACGAVVTDQGGPAVGLANAIKDRSLSGDVYMSADAHVNQTLIGADNGDWVRWYLAFARNQEVISYTPKSRFFAELERARRGEVPWYRVLMLPGFVLGRTDPNTDPGGYYALFVAQLAQRYYGIADLRQRLLGGDTNPDQLLTSPSFTTTAAGNVPDATFGYLSSAVDKGLSFIALPPQIDLSQPSEARRYARASFTNDHGVTFRGAPIYDSVTVLRRSAGERTAIDFVRALLSPQGHRSVLARGFLDTPVLVGGDAAAVPVQLRRFIAGCFEQRRCRRDDHADAPSRHDQHERGRAGPREGRLGADVRPAVRSRPRASGPRVLATCLAVTVLAAVGARATATADSPSPCGATGGLSGGGPFTCTYTTIGSDTFPVPPVSRRPTSSSSRRRAATTSSSATPPIRRPSGRSRAGRAAPATRPPRRSR